MILLKRIFLASTAFTLAATLSACTPKVGSEEWCEMMKEKPKGEWSANEAGEFTKYCVLGMHDDK